jgi:small conductance mechanosensitive channel
LNFDSVINIVRDNAIAVGMKILGALVLYIIGRWLISMLVRALQTVLTKQKIEPTVLRFAGNALSVALNITLVVAILGYFGFQTTTFAALIAAAGLAIGMAWPACWLILRLARSCWCCGLSKRAISSPRAALPGRFMNWACS